MSDTEYSKTHATIPVDQFDFLIRMIEKGLTNPEHQPSLDLARINLRTLKDWSPSTIAAYEKRKAGEASNHE